MNEALRQQYLGAMGIQPWYCRYRLPNARPSVIKATLPEPDNDALITKSTSLPHQVLAPPTPERLKETRPAPVASNRANLNQLLGKTSETESKTSIPSSQSTIAVKQPAKKQETGEQNTEIFVEASIIPTPFRVIVTAPNDHCLVVADMPHSGEKMVTRFHTNLLSNILKAVNETVGQIEYREFSWPFSIRSFIVQNDANAKEALTEFLDNQYGLHRRKTVLLLGPYAARFVLEPTALLEDLRGVRKFAAGRCATSFSLDQMMKMPDCKRDAWRDLSPLLQSTTQPTTQPTT